MICGGFVVDALLLLLFSRDENAVADSVVVRVELVDMVSDVGDDKFTGIVAAVSAPLLCNRIGVAGDIVSRTESSTVSFDSLSSRAAASLLSTGDNWSRTSPSTTASASSVSSA